jgi:bifunctional phosphoglucose/phosphomannose isomerase
MKDAESQFPKDLLKYDAYNYKKHFKGYAEDLRTSYNRTFRSLIEKIDFDSNIIIVGSSWSLNAARIVGDHLRGKVRLSFAESYDDSLTLTNKDVVIVISYSGASEEGLSWLKLARRVGAKALIITAGGRLAEDSFDTPVIELVKGLPSRASAFTIIGTLLRLFEDAGLVSDQHAEVQDAVNFLREQDVSAIAMDLSSKFYGVIPLIYASSSLQSCGDRFKRLINANAKASAFFNVLSGADYYEAEGFLNKNALFHALFISSSEDLSRLKKKISVYKGALQNQGVDVTDLNINAKGLVRVVTAILVADVSSYYLALRYNQDPLNDETTRKIKRDMGIYL